MSEILEKFGQKKYSRTLLETLKDATIGEVYHILAVPKNEDIRPMSRINRKIPRLMSFLVEWEARQNKLVGICAATGEPIYPPSHFFKDQAIHYLTLTPGVGGKRAEQIVETLVGGALHPPQQKGNVIDLGEPTPLTVPDEGVNR